MRDRRQTTYLRITGTRMARVRGEWNSLSDLSALRISRNESIPLSRSACANEPACTFPLDAHDTTRQDFVCQRRTLCNRTFHFDEMLVSHWSQSRDASSRTERSRLSSISSPFLSDHSRLPWIRQSTTIRRDHARGETTLTKTVRRDPRTSMTRLNVYCLRSAERLKLLLADRSRHVLLRPFPPHPHSTQYSFHTSLPCANFRQRVPVANTLKHWNTSISQETWTN